MKRRWFAAPYGVWMVLFTIVPIFLILYYAVTDAGGSLTLDNFRQLADPLYLKVLGTSLGIALLCTLICLLLGYPAAYFLSRKAIDKKGVLVLLFIVPMWMNFLLRTYAWLALLESNGPITKFVNMVADWFGHDGDIRLLYNYGAVLMGMVYNYLPFMILPLHSVMTKLDGRVVEAAEDLGATKAQVFFRVIVPLSVPGIVSGITMVFMPAVTTFVISRLLGGGQFKLIGDLIESEFLTFGNWNLGSALALVMMILILLSMGLMNRFDKGQGGTLL